MALSAMDLVAAAKQNITEISVEEARKRLADMLILDVREPAEFEAGHIPGAINIPRGVLEFKISGHPDFQGAADRDILVYCQSGGRSALAAEALHKLGYTRAVSMAGGFKAWLDNNYEVE